MFAPHQKQSRGDDDRSAERRKPAKDIAKHNKADNRSRDDF